MKHIKLITVIILILFSLLSKGEDRIGVLQINVWQEGTCVPGGFDAGECFLHVENSRPF